MSKSKAKHSRAARLLSIGFWNCNCASHHKLDAVDSFLRVRPDLLAFGLCETKHPTHPLPLHACKRCPAGYAAWRKPFAEGHAGIAVFVHKSVVCRERPDLSCSLHTYVLHTLKILPNFSEIAAKACSDLLLMHKVDDTYIDSLPASNLERYEVGWVPDFV